ncbi:MAG: hypothetical protein PHT99_07890 [Methanoregula sp.]|nr:hypothetical protein [Methanoregula sp.]
MTGTGAALGGKDRDSGVCCIGDEGSCCDGSKKTSSCGGER